MKPTRRRVGEFTFNDQSLVVDVYTDWEGEISPKMRLYHQSGQTEINCTYTLRELGEFLLECDRRMNLESGVSAEQYQKWKTPNKYGNLHSKFSVDESGKRKEKIQE